MTTLKTIQVQFPYLIVFTLEIPGFRNSLLTFQQDNKAVPRSWERCLADKNEKIKMLCHLK